jgi:hypothetical protein
MMNSYPYYGYAVDEPQFGFLGTAGWAPNGFVDPATQAVQIRAARDNIWMPLKLYAHFDPFPGTYEGGYRGDEAFSGETFQYIPTQSQIGAGIAALNMQAAVYGRPGGERTSDWPQFGNPAMQQLIKSLYEQAGALWQELRQANAAGIWSE